MKSFAKAISAIFHPLLFPTYAIMLLYYSPTYLQMEAYEVKKAVFIIIFLITFISPILSLVLLINFKIIKNIFVDERSERILPFLTVSLFYIGGYYILQNFPIRLPYHITSFLLVSAISAFAAFIINFRTKISAHTISIGSFLGFGIVFFYSMNLDAFYFTVITILLSALIAASRMYLKSHKPSQIYLGFFTGLVIGLSPIIGLFLKA